MCRASPLCWRGLPEPCSRTRVEASTLLMAPWVSPKTPVTQDCRRCSRRALASARPHLGWTLFSSVPVLLFSLQQLRTLQGHGPPGSQSPQGHGPQGHSPPGSRSPRGHGPPASLSPRVTVTPWSQTLGSQSPRVTPSWSRSPRPSLNTLPCAAVTSLPASQGLPSALGSERIRQLRNFVSKKPNNQLLLQMTRPDRKQD